MGRLHKKGIDYFSHDVMACMRPTLYTLQQSFGNDGYAFWYKLLEFLGTQDGLYADFSDNKTWTYFLSLAMVDSQKGEEIMTMLAGIDAIDCELWRQRRIVWSDNFRDREACVFVKRHLDAPQKPQIDAVTVVPVPAETTEETETKPPEKKTEKKTRYAEFVHMTDTEYKSLVERVGEAAAAKCVEVLDNYKGSSGKTYKSDYRAILNWVIDRVGKDHPGLIRKTAAAEATERNGNPFGEFEEG